MTFTLFLLILNGLISDGETPTNRNATLQLSDQSNKVSSVLSYRRMEMNGFTDDQSLNYLIYGGMISTAFLSDQFKSLEENDIVNRSAGTFVLGVKTWYQDFNYWFTDFQYFAGQKVTSNLNKPLDNLFISGWSVSGGISPMGMSFFRPYAAAGYGYVNFGENPLGLPQGEHLTTHEGFWNAGLDLIFGNLALSADYKRSFYSTEGRKISQFQFKLGFVL